MNILLDTHIILWWFGDSPKLSKKARNYITDGNNLIFISAASIWEISIKKAIGKLQSPSDLKHALQINSFETLPINFDHAELAGKLPQHHFDPFDRMVIAQSQIENFPVLTHDKHFKLYKINVLTC